MFNIFFLALIREEFQLYLLNEITSHATWVQKLFVSKSKLDNK